MEFFAEYRKLALNIIIPLESPLTRASFLCIKCWDGFYLNKCWAADNNTAKELLVELKVLFDEEDKEDLELAKERFIGILRMYDIKDQEKIRQLPLPDLFMPGTNQVKQQHICFDQKGKEKKKKPDSLLPETPKALEQCNTIAKLNNVLRDVEAKRKQEIPTTTSQRPASESHARQSKELLGKRGCLSQESESILDVKSMLKSEGVTDKSKPDSLTIDQTSLSCYKLVEITYRDGRKPLRVPANLVKELKLLDKR